MKEEIKEILDNTLEYLEGIDETRNTKILTTIETNILLDYITNLQEENERLKIEKQEEYNRFNLMAKFRDKALERTLIYKSRIDKAIEYITTEQLYTNYQWGKSQYEKILKDLLNILQGEDKE